MVPVAVCDIMADFMADDVMVLPRSVKCITYALLIEPSGGDGGDPFYCHEFKQCQCFGIRGRNERVAVAPHYLLDTR